MSEDVTLPFLGFGLGLRPAHYPFILEHRPQVDWFEAISENYMVPGGRASRTLEKIRERYPVVLHGVSLSLGSSDPLNKEYLKQLKDLARRIEPAWMSDHLCWTGVGGKNLHDLLPLPYTEETLKHVSKRIRQVQDFLERPILVENVSSYMEFRDSSMTEWDFLRTVSEESGCHLLLDINNIYVSSVNHEFDPMTYLKAMPPDRISQFHLAGHSDKDGYLLDTHDHPVKPAVWKLYQEALKLFGSVSTMIEWDENIPKFPKLFKTLQKARKLHRDTFENNTSQNPAPSLAAHYGA